MTEVWTAICKDAAVFAYRDPADPSGGHVRFLQTNGAGEAVSLDTDIETTVSKHSFWGQCQRGRALLQPGEYRPRIQRQLPLGRNLEPDMALLYPAACQSALQSARNLFLRLQDVFRFIEPDAANVQTFGHELRHLHILACTEVESNLKAVLTANGARPLDGNRYTMKDYRRLLAPMRLGEWKIILPSYPALPLVVPFDSWPATSPPSWWSDYNAVKHDRETALNKATLGNVIDAMAGVYVSIAGQFGAITLHYRDGLTGVAEEMRADDKGAPKWGPEELYVPTAVPGGRTSWTAMVLFPKG